MRTNNWKIALLPALCLILFGCSRGPNVYYGDPSAVEVVTIDYGSTDLQTIAEKMVDSLLASPALGNDRPVVYFAGIKMNTDEHIDTKSITDKIRVKLLRSGRVQFTAAMEKGDEFFDQLQYQNDSGMVNPVTAKRYAQQYGADFFFFGEITNIRKRAGRVEDNYMKFTMNLVDIETALLTWADEHEIRKGSKRAMFGR